MRHTRPAPRGQAPRRRSDLPRRAESVAGTARQPVGSCTRSIGKRCRRCTTRRAGSTAEAAAGSRRRSVRSLQDPEVSRARSRHPWRAPREPARPPRPLGRAIESAAPRALVRARSRADRAPGRRTPDRSWKECRPPRPRESGPTPRSSPTPRARHAPSSREGFSHAYTPRPPRATRTHRSQRPRLRKREHPSLLSQLSGPTPSRLFSDALPGGCSRLPH